MQYIVRAYYYIYIINLLHIYIYIYISGMRSMRSRVFSGLFIFWDFICLKSLYFPSFFSQSSLSGPMRFPYPADTTDR